MAKRIGDRRREPQGGFTLIELLVVIVILGILSAVVVFAVRGINDRGSASAVAADAETLRTAQETYCAQNGSYTDEQGLVDARFLSGLSTYNDIELGTPTGPICGPNTYQLRCEPVAPGCGEAGGTTPYEVGWESPITSNIANERTGYKMTDAGDINRDGATDVWALASNYDVDVEYSRWLEENDIQEEDEYYVPEHIYALDGRALAEGRRVVLTDIAGGYYNPDVPPTVAPEDDFPGTETTFAGNSLSPQLTNMGDVGGGLAGAVTPPDGVPDLLATEEPRFDPSGDHRIGRAWVFNGATGRVLYQLENPYHQVPFDDSRYGFATGNAGDLPNALGVRDGIPEAMVGAASKHFPLDCDRYGGTPACTSMFQGQVVINDGATGAVLRTLDLPAEDIPGTGCTSLATCSFGVSAQSPGDVTGDNIPDQLVGAQGINLQGRLYLFSGADGTLVSKIDPPVAAGSAAGWFGYQFVPANTPGDVNNDGKAEIFGASFRANGPTGLVREGRAWVFDGASVADDATGGTPGATVLYELTDPSPQAGGHWGNVMVAADSDRNGKNDRLYVGATVHTDSAPGGTTFSDDRFNGGVALFDAADGRSIREAVTPPGLLASVSCGDIGRKGRPLMGWSLASVGDVDNDRQPDVVAGAPWYEPAPCDTGNYYPDIPWRRTDIGALVTFLTRTP